MPDLVRKRLMRNLQKKRSQQEMGEYFSFSMEVMIRFVTMSLVSESGDR